MKSEKMKIVDKASELTFSNILLKGEANIKLDDNGEFFVVFDKDATVCGVMESLYILDNMGFDIDEITFTDNPYEKDIFIISEDVEREMLKDCLHVYKIEYRIDKEQVYDYDIIDDYDNYSYISGDNNWLTGYTNISPNKNYEQRSYNHPKLNLEGEYEHPKNTTDVEECLNIEFDPSKFKSIKGKDASLKLFDFIDNDIESGENMVELGNKVDKMFCEYIDLMNKNIKDESKYEEIHLKRINMVESARIKMKEHKTKRVYIKLEAKASLLCDDVKDSEKEYIEYIILSVLSLKKIVDKSINTLLDGVFDPFASKIREQHEVILNILRTSGGEC